MNDKPDLESSRGELLDLYVTCDVPISSLRRNGYGLAYDL